MYPHSTLKQYSRGKHVVFQQRVLWNVVWQFLECIIYWFGAWCTYVRDPVLQQATRVMLSTMFSFERNPIRGTKMPFLRTLDIFCPWHMQTRYTVTKRIMKVFLKDLINNNWNIQKVEEHYSPDKIRDKIHSQLRIDFLKFSNSGPNSRRKARSHNMGWGRKTHSFGAIKRLVTFARIKGMLICTTKNVAQMFPTIGTS